MNILLIGASGMIGTRIMAEASDRGHSIVATARAAARVADLPGVSARSLDLSDTRLLTELAQAADVIIAATAPRSSGDPVIEAARNTAALVAAARATGKRLVLVGGAGSLNLPDGSPVLPHVPEAYQAEARAMKAAYQWLKASDVNWTFFAPALMIAPGPRKAYRLGTDTALFAADGSSQISAEDYAAALLDEVETPAHRQSIMTIGY